jgi:hypothetical protein
MLNAHNDEFKEMDEISAGIISNWEVTEFFSSVAYPEPGKLLTCGSSWAC